jgi:hypothetical protein
MPDRNRRILEHIAYDTERLQRQAAAIGQDMLAYLLDHAALEARSSTWLGLGWFERLPS